MNKYLFLFLTLILMNNTNTILYDFNKNANISDWRVVDDVVMGGRSNGKISLDENGNGIYTGAISLENNGGFSSLRYRFTEKNINSYSVVKIRLKGDGKKYQFRIKKNITDYHSYIAVFTTSKEWQTIEINLSKMYPAFRGRKLVMPNFTSKTIEEVAFLIGNKKEEGFRLEIDKIYLE